MTKQDQEEFKMLDTLLNTKISKREEDTERRIFSIQETPLTGREIEAIKEKMFKLLNLIISK